MVYSTGPDGRQPDAARCRRCGEATCCCEPASSRPAREHDLRVRRERSGRKGKTVTIAGTFFLTRADAAALLKRLKKSCGGGGTLVAVPGDEPGFALELQGDHGDRLLELLAGLGFRAKRSGG